MATGLGDSDAFLVEDLLSHLLIQPADQDDCPSKVQGHPRFLRAAASLQSLAQC